ncbi:ComEA family DNA-binding protein [Chitinophaga sp. 22321]|uniref:Helix-hairpin-helix domain-containing protein n=1 Tax=Chitinophaga hostae TaxID=2831022 RepID=A0ABS5J0K3_9BACT|nr:helix-hairpin-helix domain-containing protein [Chitinophaga hostae]MBS0028758.1 helix-hairpin-helix domain-containing protein [Chitinophaga hostae]
MWKSFIREYLRFSRKERTGIFTLVLLIIATAYTPDALFYFQRRMPVADSNDLGAAVMAFEAGIPKTDEAPAAGKLFYFDPNSLSAEGWQQLGVSERTAVTIGKYLARGGHFRVAADLEKIYSLPPALCTRLMPYVRISGSGKADRHLPASGRYQLAVHQKGYRQYPRDSSYRERWRYDSRGQYQGGFSGNDTRNAEDSTYHSFNRYRKKAPPVMIDINAADTLVWATLPGIGPGFARRIVAFRERLGGFYSVVQVGECYGLADSVFQKIQPFLQIGNSSLIKLDLNLTDEKSLAAHPYIRYKLAHLIVQYRSTHAGFREVSELRGLPLVDEIIYRKIEHYIDIKH